MFKTAIVRVVTRFTQKETRILLRLIHNTTHNVLKQSRLLYHSKWCSSCVTNISRQFHASHFRSAVEEVRAPNFPDSISSGDVKLIKKEGDAVAMDEVVLEIETDKTALPVMSPGHGKIVKMLVTNGQAVKAQQPLFQVDVTGVAPVGVPAAAAKAPRPAPAASSMGTCALSKAPASAAPAPAPAAPVTAPPPPPPKLVSLKKVSPSQEPLKTDPTKTISGTRSEHPIPMNKLRKAIAKRLKEAQNTTAMLTTFSECDMGNLMAFRKANLEKFMQKFGVKLSFMSPFLKASASALLDQPVMNAVIKGDEVVYRDFVDISVAVATPRGLMVPVIRNVHAMDFPQIELTIGGVAKKARDGKLTMSDMQGGTFTISNGGVFGSLLSMPIINLPQTAILGMHAIIQRPVSVDGDIEIRPMMYLALSYDHRLVDGREAAQFLKKLRSGIEDPATILADV